MGNTPSNNEASSGTSALDDGLGFAACRDAFVSMIKNENFYREPGCKVSLKAHWTGAGGGFSDEWLQKRWHDFLAGWAAKPAAPNDGVTGLAPREDDK